MSKPSRRTTDIASITEPVDYEPDTDTYRAFFDERLDSVSLATISVVAKATETDPTAINPLHSVIDPEALDALLNTNRDAQTDSNIRVTFTFEGYEVTIHSHGMIRVTPETQPDPDG